MTTHDPRGEKAVKPTPTPDDIIAWLSHERMVRPGPPAMNEYDGAMMDAARAIVRSHAALSRERDELRAELALAKRREEAALNIATDRTEEHIKFQRERHSLEERVRQQKKILHGCRAIIAEWAAMMEGNRSVAIDGPPLLQAIDAALHLSGKEWAQDITPTHNGVSDK